MVDSTSNLGGAQGPQIVPSSSATPSTKGTKPSTRAAKPSKPTEPSAASTQTKTTSAAGPTIPAAASQLTATSATPLRRISPPPLPARTRVTTQAQSQNQAAAANVPQPKPPTIKDVAIQSVATAKKIIPMSEKDSDKALKELAGKVTKKELSGKVKNPESRIARWVNLNLNDPSAAFPEKDLEAYLKAKIDILPRALSGLKTAREKKGISEKEKRRLNAKIGTYERAFEECEKMSKVVSYCNDPSNTLTTDEINQLHRVLRDNVIYSLTQDQGKGGEALLSSLGIEFDLSRDLKKAIFGPQNSNH